MMGLQVELDHGGTYLFAHERETGGKVILSHDMEQWSKMKHAPEYYD